MPFFFNNCLKMALTNSVPLSETIMAGGPNTAMNVLSKFVATSLAVLSRIGQATKNPVPLSLQVKRYLKPSLSVSGPTVST